MAEARKALFNEVGIEGLKRLIRELFSRALNGDVAAAKVVLLWTIGRPTEMVDVDNVDADEWSRLNASPSVAAVLRALLDGIGCAQAVEMLAKVQEGRAQDGPAAVLDRQDNRTLSRVEREADHRVGK
jgi:hypothetical protein